MMNMNCNMAPQNMQPGMGAGMQPGNCPVRMGMFQNPGERDARCMLRRQIDEASFAMDDVHLFLDTHPEDAVAFQYFKNAVALRQNAVNTYERQYGPLQVENAVGNTWSWVTEKWPWEGDC